MNNDWAIDSTETQADNASMQAWLDKLGQQAKED